MDFTKRTQPMKQAVLTAVIVGIALVCAVAQDQAPGPGRMPGESVAGKVTAIGNDSLTITPLRGGDPVTIKVGGETRVMKDRQPAKLTEIKVGDTVMARGQLSGNTMQARMLGVLNPDMVERMQQGGAVGFGGGGGYASRFKPEDWGKTFIAGRVKGINETTLTIARQDSQQTLDIEVDENTSFKKGRDSVTLADIKADDFVSGEGELKNGIFVARELRIGGGRRFTGQPNPGADQSAPAGDKSVASPKN